MRWKHEAFVPKIEITHTLEFTQEEFQQFIDLVEFAQQEGLASTGLRTFIKTALMLNKQVPNSDYLVQQWAKDNLDMEEVYSDE